MISKIKKFKVLNKIPVNAAKNCNYFFISNSDVEVSQTMGSKEF